MDHLAHLQRKKASLDDQMEAMISGIEAAGRDMTAIRSIKSFRESKEKWLESRDKSKQRSVNVESNAMLLQVSQSF